MIFAKRKVPFSALHCMNLVYKSDWENAICIKSVADLEKRRSLFALRAFNVAILTSIEKVSKPIFAQARIDFLKTGVDQIYKKEPIPDHPILQELKYSVEQVGSNVMIAVLENHCFSTSIQRHG